MQLCRHFALLIQATTGKLLISLTMVYGIDVATVRGMNAETPTEGDAMKKRCPHCGSTDRFRLGKRYPWHCMKCKRLYRDKQSNSNAESETL